MPKSNIDYDATWSPSKKLHVMMTELQNHNFDLPKRKTEFRVSGLPYCPLLQIADSLADSKDNQAYAMQHYVRIGTTLHTLIQEFMPKLFPGEIIGDWECTKVLDTKINNATIAVTKCTHVVKMCSFKDLKIKCPNNQKNCKKIFQYREIEFSYLGLSGHLDCLLKIDDKYYILDFKTTGNFLFDEPALAVKRGYYPSKKYREQIETYAILLEKQYNIKINFYALVYIARDKPTVSKGQPMHRIFARKLTQADKDARYHLMQNQIKSNSYVEKFLQSGKLSTLQKAYDLKPCNNEKDYKDKMSIKYFGKECCPYVGDTCFKGKVKKELMAMYKDSK